MTSVMGAILQSSLASASSPRAFTVADSIETTRIMYGFDYRKNAVRFSPDGTRFLIVLYRGDIARNGNWVQFFSGKTDSIHAARKSRVVKKLFTRTSQVAHLLGTPIVFLSDNKTIVFIWHSGDELGQVVTLNLETGKLKQISRARQPIEYFDITPDGRTLMYVTRARHSQCERPCVEGQSTHFRELLRSGFVVPDHVKSAATLLNGYTDDEQLGYQTSIYIATAAKGYVPLRVPLNTYVLPPLRPKLSPNGEYAVIAAPPASIPDHWAQYTDAQIQRNLTLARTWSHEPLALRQLWLIETRNGKAKPLWDVPYAAPPELLWAPTSDRIYICQTGFPVQQANAVGLAGKAHASVDVKTGHFAPMYVNIDRHDAPPSHLDGPCTIVGGGRAPAVRIELREGPNTPPAVWVLPQDGSQAELLMDLNPRLLQSYYLGRAEIVHWQDSEHRSWSGRLFLPPKYQLGERVPLVILTMHRNATLPEQYTLRGAETTSSVLSIAQPLASRHIAVLTMGQPDVPALGEQLTPREGHVLTQGYESAIRYLENRSLIAIDRVGLVGYSRTGFYVQYALTHSDFPFKTAISSDNVTQSYVQYVLQGSQWVKDEFERVNGGVPVGDGLRNWIANAPGFNADRIRTPLRMEINSGRFTAFLSQWELFSMLRRLRKPVELYILPDIEQGSHGLLRPDQQIASLGGAVDWLDFWLNDRDSSLDSNPQHERWERLRALQVLK